MIKNTRMYTVGGTIAVALLLVGGGCVTVGPGMTGPGPDPRATVNAPTEVTPDNFAAQTSAPAEYLGQWDAPDLGKTVSFNSSADTGNGMFSVGEGSFGIWYEASNGGILLLQSQGGPKVDVQYREPSISGNALNMTTLDGTPVTWTKK